MFQTFAFSSPKSANFSKTHQPLSFKKVLEHEMSKNRKIWTKKPKYGQKTPNFGQSPPNMCIEETCDGRPSNLNNFLIRQDIFIP